ncbi:MAG: cytochrome c biogenesis protein CcsA [Campylobacterales bacterium]|nr:cytochrome c biogenesis protein CcsA [Campylobacterales bacterium]
MSFVKFLFSMKMAVVMLVAFGVIVGAATFIENDYGTQSAKALVYSAKWFELFLWYFIALIVYNIIIFCSYKTKFPIFLFHFSFLFIAIGALMTRYIGFEGSMPIREGDITNQMLSESAVLQVRATSGKMIDGFDKQVYFSSITKNKIEKSIHLGASKINVKLKEYLPSVGYEVVPDANGTTILELMISKNQNGKSYYLKKGEVLNANGVTLSFDKFSKVVLYFNEEKDCINFTTAQKVKFIKVEDMSEGELPSGSHSLEKKKLYTLEDGTTFILKNFYKNSVLKRVSKSLKPLDGGEEFALFEVRSGEFSKEVPILFSSKRANNWHHITFDNIDVDINLGAKVIELPFSLKLRDFILDRYPGSDTPSSYASEISVMDSNRSFDYRIYMNHVLDYKGYRFFQASYDPDEKGTVLAVNHDPGTKVTYVGYFLLTLGMFWSLFAKNGRFQKLLSQTRKLQSGALTFLIFFSMFSFSPLKAETIQQFDMQHIKSFSSLALQDAAGRMKPVDTMANEVLAKIYGKKSFEDKSASEVFLGMMLSPDAYEAAPIIKISHPQIAKDIGLDKNAKYASFKDFFDGKNYKLFNLVQEANRKRPIERSKYDKELIDVDERVNVAYMAFQGSLFRVFPLPNDPNNTWLAPIDALNTIDDEKLKKLVQVITSNYFTQVSDALVSGDWSKADEGLEFLRQYQKKFGATVMPNKEQIDFEILYNKLDIFSKLTLYYIFFACIALIFIFFQMFRGFSSSKVVFTLFSVLSFGLLVHLLGVALRWYISGYAPWSNAYGAMIFIGAMTIFAGLIVGRKNLLVLCASALLGGITMLVAHLSDMNPQITTLMPVLKSYWLMIHVALIISGDGFLGLGSILSLFALMVMVFKDRSISAQKSLLELTNLSEMSIIIGLVLFTVGNFLGGVWANESWGRYWGWDPKETWAAVTILIYAAVLHLRFIPLLKSNYIYNLAALWAYSSVLMTYFGVNYYLSGLHSYAAGDPVPIPVWVYYVVTILVFLSITAWFKREKVS